LLAICLVEGDPEVLTRLAGLALDISAGDDAPSRLRGQARAVKTKVLPLAAAASC
jgi:hypothetical protein